MNFSSLLRSLASCLLFVSAAAKASTAATPPELVGAWQVTQVALDTKDQPHWRYEPNDPRILGRILDIGADGHIMFNFKRERCDKVAWSAGATTTLTALTARGFLRPQKAGLPRNPNLRDFELKLTDHSVTPMSAVCTGAQFTANTAARWADAWFANIEEGKLAVGYDGDTVLVLMKLTPSTAPAPSFSCQGILSPTELAICHSPALAGFDRSVAAAYKRSLRRRTDNREDVIAEQRNWLKMRDSCKSEASCLEDRMRERIDALMQD